MHKSLFIAAIIIFLYAVPGVIAAAPGSEIPAIKTGTKRSPWHINADRITYNRKTDIYTATGNVMIRQGDKTLRAEKVRVDHGSMEATAQGNIRLSAGGDTLSGDEMSINLKTSTGTITRGLLFIEKKHFYIKGDKIIKTGKATYIIKKGSFTSCDGESPAWRITGKELNVTLEGYGTVRDATLWAKNIPILYSPYLIFPAKRKRQSGLLPPQFGFSDRNGIEFIQPYYWAINRSRDATLYLHHIQRRGEKFGAEYRYALSRESKGTIMIDSLNDRKKDDGSGNSSSDWGYTDDDALRTNSDRYWFRAKLDQAMPYDFTAKLDLDVVSDQDYLREFSDGYTGYDATKKYFESEFGRDIDDDDDPVRENRLNISKNWTSYGLNADLRWYDNVISRRQHETDTTLQQLPEITFYALKQPLFHGPLYFDLDSEYSYFYRKDIDRAKRDAITGQRSDIHPRIYYPYQYKHYFTLEPSVGFRQTLWYSDHEGIEPADADKYQHRELYDLQVDLSTDIFNVFAVNGESIDKIKHTIIPKLEYTYVPDLDQSEYPDYDKTDRIEKQNMLTLSITNLFIAKHRPQKNDHSPVSAAYHQFCRFMIEQPYDFNLQNSSGDSPFRPLYAEIDITPLDFFTLQADAQWNHHLGTWDSHNILCKLNDMRGDRLSIEHRYTHKDSQSVLLDLKLALTGRVSIYGGYERNLKDGKDIKKSMGWLYQAQCWSFELSAQKEDNDKKVGCMINLYGLGGMGNRL